MVFYAESMKAGAAGKALDASGGVLVLTAMTLEVDPADPNTASKVYIRINGNKEKEYLLCVLDKHNLNVSGLELHLDDEDKATMVVRGTGTVHVTGYIEFDESDDETDTSTSAVSTSEVEA